jgi:hypothetical protein
MLVSKLINKAFACLSATFVNGMSRQEAYGVDEETELAEVLGGTHDWEPVALAIA